MYQGELLMMEETKMRRGHLHRIHTEVRIDSSIFLSDYCVFFSFLERPPAIVEIYEAQYTWKMFIYWEGVFPF